MTKKLHFAFLLSGYLLLSLSQSCSPEKHENPEASNTDSSAQILFSDSMSENWKENWFLDGEKATLEHRDDGLFFSGGTVTKMDDPEEYHAHHAVLWTKQEFEGDIRISYQWKRMESSDYGAILLYVQAQGVGEEPYAKDISKWNELRRIPSMDKYFKNMDLLSLSIRENLRCKRYPWFDREGNKYQAGGLIEPMVDYQDEIVEGRIYDIVVEKRNPTISMRITDTETGKVIINHTWDTSKIDERVEPDQVTKGRIGLRHMSTRQAIYKDFKVEQL